MCINTFLLVLIRKILEIFEKRPFFRRIWPDWVNTAWADMAGLGSKEKREDHLPSSKCDEGW